jgi:branched-chain amino acid transport system substrate-binding protein
MATEQGTSAPVRPSVRLLGSRRARLTLVAGAAAALALISACSSSSSSGGSSGGTGGGGGGSSSGGTIKLGISVPLSGAVGSSCGPMNKAMLAWFDHVNSTGGVNGAKIDVDNRDDAYDAARAVTNTKAFIAEKVVAVTGQCGSLQPPAQVPLLNAAKIPFLFSFGASTSLLKPLSPMYFNLMPTYGDQLVAEIPYVFQHNGSGSVVIVNTTTPDAPTTTSEVKDAVQKAGGNFLGSYDAPPGTADFSPYVLKIKQQHPDYVVLDQTPQDAARLTESMTANGFSPAKFLIGSSAVSQQTFLDGVSKALQPKLLVTSDTLVPANAGSTQCATVLKAAGISVESVTLRGCGTAQVVVKALQDTPKPVTSASLVKTIEGWNNVTASEIYPPVSFSATNHVGLNSLYVFGVKDGVFYQAGELSGSGS